MSGAHRGSRVVFVGNIPYDFSEEQLIEVFKEVGTVVGFRLVFDRDTGKAKGYGFCEFEDSETAASAVRNLNDKEVGGRPMRIDFADVDPMFEGRTTQMGQVDSANQGAARGGPPPALRGSRAGAVPGAQQQSERQLPPNLPKGQILPPGVDATDSISQTLAALPPNQLLDIMSQMKSLVTSSPEQARTLLNGHPQLAYALFQAMLMMNVVDATILQRILTTSGALGPDANGPAIPPPQHADYSGGLPARPPPPQQQPQQQHQQQQQQQHQHQMAAYPGPSPMSHPSMPPPPPQQQQQQQQPQNMSHLPDEQRALLEQVLQLTPDQIAALPADQQEGIRQLKASLGQA
ncbi:hypothetical protein CBS101457_000588 [Exobasidium rhododendri]|nr:hypothetical protein CBS101457_000588 [Exobasidium rhododendri]